MCSLLKSEWIDRLECEREEMAPEVAQIRETEKKRRELEERHASFNSSFTVFLYQQLKTKIREVDSLSMDCARCSAEFWQMEKLEMRIESCQHSFCAVADGVEKTTREIQDCRLRLDSFHVSAEEIQKQVCRP